MMFKSLEESHQHSLSTLSILNSFIEFKLSIRKILDLGCGNGQDLNYWASMEDDDEENPKRLNFKCWGLTNKYTSDLESVRDKNENVKLIEHDFNTDFDIPYVNNIDVVWCHDVLQCCYNPLYLLRAVNRVMAKNGMLCLTVPSTFNVNYGVFKNYTFANQYYTFTTTQIIYLLALCGFDCNDFYLKKEKHDDCIQVITYKSRDPYDPETTWYGLQEDGCFNESASEIILKYGHLSDQGLITKWIDGTVFDYRYHTR